MTVEALRLTVNEWAERMERPMRDHSYTQTRLGPHIVTYKAWKTPSCSPRTIDQYERDLARMALALDLELQDVRTEDLMLVLALFPRASQRRAASVYSDFFKWARTRRPPLIDENPCELLPRIESPKAKVYDIFTAGEQGKLISAAMRGWMPAVDRLRVLLLLDTGARKGEARALRVLDTNLSDRYVVLHGKGGKERLVEIRGDVVRAFEEFLLTPLPALGRCPEPEDHVWFPMRATGQYGAREEGVVWVQPGRRMAETTFMRWWAGLVERSGVRYRKPHMTRHTFATNLVDAGVNLVDVQELLGHESPATTQVYVHSSRKRLGHAIEALAKERGERGDH